MCWTRSAVTKRERREFFSFSFDFSRHRSKEAPFVRLGQALQLAAESDVFFVLHTSEPGPKAERSFQFLAGCVLGGGARDIKPQLT